MRKKRAQSILEYVIVLTVIVAAIALAANAVIKPAMNTAYNSASGAIENAAARISL